MVTKYYTPYDPIVNLEKMAALKAKDAAEAFFKVRHLELAIKQAMVAKQFDPELHDIDHFILAYQIHRAVSEKKDWYHVLGFQKITDYETVKKRYKELARLVHPDKNSSVAAEGAFKHVKAAWDSLSDPAKKKAYDMSLLKKSDLRSSTKSQQAAANVKKTRKRTCPSTSKATGDDRGIFKKSFKIVRTTNPGQKTCVMRISVCQVA